MYLPPEKHPPGSRIRLTIGLTINAGLLLVVTLLHNLLDVPLIVGLAVFIGGGAPYVAYVLWWQRKQKFSVEQK